jgi:hypothetical protein
MNIYYYHIFQSLDFLYVVFFIGNKNELVPTIYICQNYVSKIWMIAFSSINTYWIGMLNALFDATK